MTVIKAFILGSLIVMTTPVRASSDTAQLAFQARDYLQATSLFEKQLEQNENDASTYLFVSHNYCEK
ncbi:MAG: hypothetical protein V7780_11820 [Colwellia sp.]|jgi:hypothetical protein